LLSMTSLGRAENVDRYYNKELNTASYYTRDAQGTEGVWGGIFADKLELSGTVSTDDFRAATRNIHPKTKEKMTQRTSSVRRVGYDLTFTAPKGVSIKAVETTLMRLEQDARTRVRVDKQDRERETGNLMWAGFTHYTARPVKGVPDPHLHRHNVVFNATYDATEDKAKAVSLADVKTNMPFYEAVFHSELAAEMHELGYKTIQNGKYWDLDLSASIIDKFSSRKAEVLEESKKRGITSGKVRARIALFSRSKKASKDISMSELRSDWEARLDGRERRKIEALYEGTSRGYRAPQRGVMPVIADALDGAFERRSFVPRSEIAATVLNKFPGSIRYGALDERLSNWPDLVSVEKGGKAYLTTKEILRSEKALLDFAKRGIAREKPLNEHFIGDKKLSEMQNRAVKHILNSRNTVTAIEGRAGSGKTSLMRTAISTIEQKDRIGRTPKKKVVVLAPTAEASRGVLRREGFKNADTLARFLLDEEMQDTAFDSVIWLDEAGLISTPDMEKLFEIAKKKKARIILSGDTKQHSAVARGDAFLSLKNSDYLRTFELTENYRQRGNPEYAAAVDAIAAGRVDEGFSKLDKMGAINEGQGYEKLAESYTEATQRGEDVLVVSPTHKEGKAVTDDIRAALLAKGRLGTKARTCRTLKNLHLADAQKRLSSSYQRGEVLRFHSASSGFRSGDQATILGSGKGWVVAFDRQRTRLALVFTSNAKVRNSFSVNEKETCELRKGDLVRFTAKTMAETPLPFISHNFAHKLSAMKHMNNGSVGRVNAIFGHQVMLENGFVFNVRSRTFTHGYVRTSQSSQGVTADRVLLAQSKRSGMAGFMNQFYVSISRGRKAIEIYTDSKWSLRKQAERLKGMDFEMSGQGLSL